MTPKKRTTRASPATTTSTTTPVTNAQLKALIDQGIVDALATSDVDRSMNSDDSYDSRTGGTEGVVELTQWFERMEIVFRISNYSMENQIKFSTCTLLGSALTWWNAHVRTVGHDVVYAMTWTNLKKMMTDKYCPKGEIKKLEVEMWNLKVKGTDVIARLKCKDRGVGGPVVVLCAPRDGVDESCERRFVSLLRMKKYARKARIALKLIEKHFTVECFEGEQWMSQFLLILLLIKRYYNRTRTLKKYNKKVKRSDKNFIAIGSAEDERQIKKLNEESKDLKKKRDVNKTPREEDTAKVPAEQEVTEQGTKKRKNGHVKMIARKRPRPQPDDDSDDEHRKCLRIVTFDSTLDSEIIETKSFVSKLHKVSSPDGDYLVVYRVNGHFRAFNYLMEVLHIFDRHDLFHLYDLVMKQYSEITPEGIELILWGDLKIMMESSTEENDQGDFWNNQQDWEIVSWRLYEACGVCILELKDGTVIYMLVERRYPLSKELLQRMLDLGLEVEEESTAALHLVRFIKQQLNEE
ncbi:reverse transcriptase domain-containing protein [Tanacetum coccineum]